ncbi:BTE_HP_G0109140.mRNA.1.CDS.1 [Saccharomyces cerevisiae]|nr:BTE_HP_G0109140.mRNA.1.CDS.1 [Saccharomyces cerevisiae]CAI6973675.1 BTE_HP_G0109140.mRNA.1.CDS.1 [Saccharomyces cerevisiae]
MIFAPSFSLIKNILLVSFLISHSFAAKTLTSSSNDDTLARSAAADADMAFFMEFLNDFDTAFPQYTSYMMQNHLTLPQPVADYYYHMVDLASTADLQSDIAQSFPFTQFQTFITAFPWYTSLLNKASATTIYLPQHFITGETEATMTNSSYASQKNSVSNSVPFSTANAGQSMISMANEENSTTALISASNSSSTSRTSQSQNGAHAKTLYFPMALFGIFAVAL